MLFTSKFLVERKIVKVGNQFDDTKAYDSLVDLDSIVHYSLTMLHNGVLNYQNRTLPQGGFIVVSTGPYYPLVATSGRFLIQDHCAQVEIPTPVQF